jgi:hypothetical protein
MAEPSARDLRAALRSLAGLRCWRTRTGVPSAGSIAYLYFGKKVRDGKYRDGRPRFTGEYVLGVFCAWRLEGAGEMLTGSMDEIGIDGPMQRGLDKLRGATVANASVRAPFLDAEVRFHDDSVLRIFCDDPDRDANWSLRVPDGTWYSATPGRITKEQYNKTRA